jgi:hypothetical protein
MSETMLPPDHPNHLDMAGIQPPRMPDFEKSLEAKSSSAPPPEGATIPARKGAGPLDPKAWEVMDLRRQGCLAADAVLKVNSLVPGKSDENGRELVRPENDSENIKASEKLLSAAVEDLLSSDPGLARGRSVDEIVGELMDLGFNARILKFKEKTPTISKLVPADAEKFYRTILVEVRNELVKIAEA